MTRQNQSANAAGEWKLAQNFLVASDRLASADMWDRATSQLYYALFHAVQAMLFTEGLEPRSHRGARHLLNVHFVVPGRVAREHLQLLQDLQDERESADYAATYPNDRWRYEGLRLRADATLGVVRRLLDTAGVP